MNDWRWMSQTATKTSIRHVKSSTIIGITRNNKETSKHMLCLQKWCQQKHKKKFKHFFVFIDKRAIRRKRPKS
jgi:hypothetical protein